MLPRARTNLPASSFEDRLFCVSAPCERSPVCLFPHAWISLLASPYGGKHGCWTVGVKRSRARFGTNETYEEPVVFDDHILAGPSERDEFGVRPLRADLLRLRSLCQR